MPRADTTTSRKRTSPTLSPLLPPSAISNKNENPLSNSSSKFGTKAQPSSTHKHVFCAIAILVTIVAIYSTSFSDTPPHVDVLPLEELQELTEKLRVGDVRLVRWDATERTHREQSKESGACQSLSLVMDQLVQLSSVQSKHLSNELFQWQASACEYATFCITDNPKHRQQFAQVDNIHSAIVKLLASESSVITATAAHVIYIATFANPTNHHAFADAGAVHALSNIIKSDDANSSELMWAAAALQNLAASYCDTPGNGRCHWEWDDKAGYVRVEDKVMSSGSGIIKKALEDESLITKLIDLTCQGPVKGKMTRGNPFPGENAHFRDDVDSPNIVPWAAAGALKNLALDPTGAKMMRDSSHVDCFCRLSHSKDWLEENKGEGILRHIHPTDPCWFPDDLKKEDERKEREGSLCIDRIFMDKDGYRCDDYGGATKDECKASNVKADRGLTANDACCGCGGGDRFKL